MRRSGRCATVPALHAPRVGRLPVLAASLGAAALALAGCTLEHSAAGAPFRPATPGVLTVATAFLPAPGFWEGSPPTRGFEAGLASALARRLGLRRVKVVQVPFASIVGGKLGGADLALSQLTPTKDREKSLDFTTPYLEAPPGVLARQGVSASDVKGLQQLPWVVSRVSTLTPIVMDQIRPDHPPVMTEDRSGALDVLRSGGADALLLDLPVALGLALSDPGFQVLGQLPGEEALAGALPNGSSNLEIVDSELRALQANGTIGKLVSRWLGTSEEDVPLILTHR
jgi:polar amino acid transport system substrate-binding protein